MAKFRGNKEAEGPLSLGFFLVASRHSDWASGRISVLASSETFFQSAGLKLKLPRRTLRGIEGARDRELREPRDDPDPQNGGGGGGGWGGGGWFKEGGV